jgi:hypothetical protein
MLLTSSPCRKSTDDIKIKAKQIKCSAFSTQAISMVSSQNAYLLCWIKYLLNLLDSLVSSSVFV